MMTYRAPDPVTKDQIADAALKVAGAVDKRVYTAYQHDRLLKNLEKHEPRFFEGCNLALAQSQADVDRAIAALSTAEHEMLDLCMRYNKEQTAIARQKHDMELVTMPEATRE